MEYHAMNKSPLAVAILAGIVGLPLALPAAAAGFV